MGRRSRPTSLPGGITSTADNRVNMIAAVVDALGKHLATHNVARGQDFWQSGSCCLWSEGHGMPSGMDAISAIVVAVGSTTIMAAADGVTIGAVRRLTRARIVSRRGNKVRNFTQALWHMVQCKKRAISAHVSVKVTRSIAEPARAGMIGLGEGTAGGLKVYGARKQSV